jgi:putative DNA primase/helicase
MGGLYPTYRGWCAEGGFFALSKVKFSQELERCVPGFAKKAAKISDGGARRRDIWRVQGVRLLEAN